MLSFSTKYNTQHLIREMHICVYIGTSKIRGKLFYTIMLGTHGKSNNKRMGNYVRSTYEWNLHPYWLSQVARDNAQPISKQISYFGHSYAFSYS